MNKLRQITASGVFASLLVIASPAVASDTVTSTVEEVETKKEKPKKITDRNHPDFVRCRSEPIIGSLSRKRRTCMTNAEWKETNRKGNRASRDFVDDNQQGFAPGNN
ncbi:hypothetical protein [Parasphingorhabdus sp.]|uniref:hypothetical protein n=1 Tax=Parasphingorhabdus sp. TaxID=2709688 RepID=UPI003BAE7EAC